MGQSEATSFTSLTLPVAASVSALGGINVSKSDFGATYFQNNPALSADTLNGWAEASHLFYFANIGFTNFAYQHDFKKIGPLSFGVNHLKLGTIQGYDALGNSIGSFDSGESTIMVGKSHLVNAFRFGVNVKGVFSNLAGSRSSALLIDIGSTFVHPKQDLTIGLVIKNLGFVMRDYSPTSSSKLPFDVQAGISFKPEHMPIRFSITAYRLVDFDIPFESAINGEKPGALDKVTSHLTFGGEILIHKNVNVLIGYNFLRHYELKLEEAGGGSGFSMGVLARIKKFNIVLSRSGYVTGGAYQVSLGIDTNKLLMKK